MVAYIIFHLYKGRKKHLRLAKEIREAEESLRRGFAILRKDIQSEFALIKKAKMAKALSEEESLREEEIIKDLREVERYVGKEIWDIEEAEYRR